MKKFWFTAFLVLGLLFSAFAASAAENIWSTKLEEFLNQSLVIIETDRSVLGIFEFSGGRRLVIENIIARAQNTDPVMGLGFYIVEKDYTYVVSYIDFDEIIPLRDAVARFCEIGLQSESETNGKDYIYKTKSGLFFLLSPGSYMYLSIPDGRSLMLDNSDIRTLKGCLDDAPGKLILGKYFGQ